MPGVNQTIIPYYIPISAKGGRRRKNLEEQEDIREVIPIQRMEELEEYIIKFI